VDVRLWNHVGWEWDADIISLYVNGLLDSAESLLGSSPAADYHLGMSGGPDPATALMSDVRVWDDVSTPDWPTLAARNDPPKIVSVTGPGPGNITTGNPLDLIVTFNEAMDMPSAQQIEIVLESGLVNAIYHSGSGTNSWTFRYIVQGSDSSASVEVLSPLNLNGVMIRSVATSEDLTDLTFTPPELNGVTINQSGPPPTITTIDPPQGTSAGGNTVTITGTSFVDGDTDVTFDGVAATDVVVNSSTELTCKPAAHAAGTVDVVVTTSGGSSDPGEYSYQPYVASVTKPANGNYTTGQTLTFQVEFSEAVDIDPSPADVPYLMLSLDGGATQWQVVYISGAGTDTLVFEREIDGGDAGTLSWYLEEVVGNAIVVAGGSILALLEFDGPDLGGVTINQSGPPPPSGCGPLVINESRNMAVYEQALSTVSVTLGSSGTIGLAASQGGPGIPDGALGAILTAQDDLYLRFDGGTTGTVSSGEFGLLLTQGQSFIVMGSQYNDVLSSIRGAEKTAGAKLMVTFVR